MTGLVEEETMVCVKRVTIIAPLFAEPLLNQEITVDGKIKKMGIFGGGSCEYKVKFDKDVVNPGESVKIDLSIDNSKCSKKIEKHKIKLLRRTQFFKLTTSRPIYTNDSLI